MADGESPAWVVETQQTLGELIKRPKLTEPLLQKPPFRFLHDIVTEVTKVTGFASGLYQEEELNSAKIKDKDSKIAYLSKIIKCVELALNTTISIRVGKVVAGLEAENTNTWLQLLYQAATTVPDSSVAVSKMSSAPMRKPEEEAPAADDAGGSKRIRPKSARRPPPKITSNEVKVDKGRGAEAAPSVSGVILEGDGGQEDDGGTIELVDNTGEAVDTRSMLNDPSGQGHGRLVRNLLDAKEEMEQKGDDKEAAVDAEEGGGGGGIILGKKGKPGQVGAGGKLPSKTEVSALRASIQTLCQSSNPLGRCLEYVQEDLEAMGKELESWRAVRHRRAGELADEEANTSSALVGFKAELEKVEELIKEKQQHIRFTKASILRNDATVERLISQVVRT